MTIAITPQMAATAATLRRAGEKWPYIAHRLGVSLWSLYKFRHASEDPVFAMATPAPWSTDAEAVVVTLPPGEIAAYARSIGRSPNSAYGRRYRSRQLQR